MSRNRRIEVDVKKLMSSQFDVELENDNLRELSVKFPGPAGTPYEGGTWCVRVELPAEYPYRSPSVVFKTPMFHPNVDDATGSVCLDVINQMWKPIFGLVNVFESFLPQLLSYPNASDPLNRRASLLYMKSKEEYNAEVKLYVDTYAKKRSFDETATKVNGTNGAKGAGAGVNGVNGVHKVNGINGIHSDDDDYDDDDDDDDAMDDDEDEEDENDEDVDPSDSELSSLDALSEDDDS